MAAGGPLRQRGVLVAGCGLLLAATRPAAAEPPLRLGLSHQMFDSVNENDGQAALRMHAEAISKSEGFTIESNQPLFGSVPEMQRALAAGEIDLLALTTVEFLALPPALVQGPLIVAIVQGRPDDEYLLVVRHDRGIENLAGLKGRRLTVHFGAKAPLTMTWLDVIAMQANLRSAARAFGEITTAAKPSRVVLPVFFGQADACVVTRGSLQVMEELNPQINRQLRVLATSQPMIPSIMCFRAGISPDITERLVRSSRKMHTTTSGRQTMTIFQSDRLEALPLSAVDSARQLLADHARLLAAFRTSAPLPAAGAPTPAPR